MLIDVIKADLVRTTSERNDVLLTSLLLSIISEVELPGLHVHGWIPTDSAVLATIGTFREHLQNVITYGPSFAKRQANHKIQCLEKYIPESINEVPNYPHERFATNESP